MAEIPPGLRTELHFPMGPKVKEVKAEHIVQGTVAPVRPAPVVPPDPPDPPDPPMAEFYVTNQPLAAACDPHKVFYLDNWTRPEGMGAEDPFNGVITVVDAITNTASVWDSSLPEFPTTMGWSCIAASERYVYIAGYGEMHNENGPQGLVVYRRDVNRENPWTVYLSASDILLLLPELSRVVPPWGWNASGLASAYRRLGLDPADDTMWVFARTDGVGEIPPRTWVICKRDGQALSAPIEAWDTGGDDPSYFGGDTPWIRDSTGGLLVLSPPVSLPMPTDIEMGAVTPTALFSLENGAYRALYTSQFSSQELFHWVYDPATMTQWEDQPKVPVPVALREYHQSHVGDGPLGSAWVPIMVTPSTVGFIAGQTINADGEVTQVFSSQPDATYYEVPTQNGKPLLTIDTPGSSSRTTIIPMGLDSSPQNRRPLMRLNDGSLLLTGNPHSAYSTFFLVTGNIAAAQTPGRVITCTNLQLERPYLTEVNAWSQQTRPWARTPASHIVEQAHDLHATATHVYFAGTQRPGDGGFRPLILRRAWNAAPYTDTPEGDASWEDVCPLGTLEALTPDADPGWDVAAIVVLVDRATLTTWVQVRWAFQGSVVAAGIYRKPPTGAWEWVGQSHTSVPMKFSGPGTTNPVYVNPALDTLYICGDPVISLPLPVVLDDGEVPSVWDTVHLSLSRVGPDTYSLYRLGVANTGPEGGTLVYSWAYTGGVWSARYTTVNIPSYNAVLSLFGGSLGFCGDTAFYAQGVEPTSRFSMKTLGDGAGVPSYLGHPIVGRGVSFPLPEFPYLLQTESGAIIACLGGSGGVF